MTEYSGRDFTISKNSTVLAGLRENSISLDGSPVDVTNKNDSGFRTLGNFSGVRSLDISASGVVDAAVIQDLAFTHNSQLLLTDITVEYADGATLSGNFFLASAENTGAHDGAVEYTVSLQSSGAWTYTAAA